MLEWRSQLNIKEDILLQKHSTWLLDPNFCLFWLDHDVLAAEDVKKKVKEKLLDLVISEIEKVSVPEGSSSGDDDQEEPSAKAAQLFMGYHKKNQKKHVANSDPANDRIYKVGIYDVKGQQAPPLQKKIKAYFITACLAPPTNSRMTCNSNIGLCGAKPDRATKQ
ncbi:hypothetical protein DPX16_23639 [Anabarilius grahami]|uniref:Uncharacterized protein n=1 Tax=Anabarilius grahami TaxID=495550 RepID=A0A3N0ZBB6_ANAGA|nr:hypothetical protein DPX16_23639 [Anabarilius grahami]